jgi:Polyketide cyclase / dehydrase and lipid transport
MSRRLPTTATVRVVVPATAEQLWVVLTAPERVGEWSHEAKGAEWLPPSRGPGLGARFAGRSAIGRRRWSRITEIVAWEPPTTIAWRTIPSGPYRDSTEWTFRLRPADGGTEIEQTYVLTSPDWWLRLLWYLAPTHRDRTAGLTDDLRRLGEVAARG